MQSIVLVFDEAQRIADVLEPRFPQLDFVQVNRGSEVLPALAKHRPQIAFSIKHSGFPAEVHRPLVEFPSLRWIHIGGSGYEHLTPWDASRLTLTNSVGVLAPFLAETTIGAMLSLNGGLMRYQEQQRARLWQPHQFKPIEDQTLLVVGLGAIGAQVAKRAKALGMRVLAIRRSEEPHPDVDELFGLDSLSRALGRTDVVSVHIRASEETRHLFNAATFVAMQPGAIFMNTSRGLVVDEPALIHALQTGQVGGAYLDVFEVEPLPHDSPLWSLPNVLITPHTADQVVDYPERFARLFADNLERWLADEPLKNVIHP